MINSKEAEKFYMQSAQVQAEEDEYGEFDYESLNSPSDELDEIGLLVQMAKQGKINPWKIDITEIADKYMLHLAELKADNLRLSSRAWLFLAILLKIKSNVLAGIETLPFDEQGQEDFQPDEGFEIQDEPEVIDYYGNKVIPIKDIIQRRTSVKLNRNRTVTLKDLIRQLEFYEQLDKKEGLQRKLEQAKRKVTAFKNLSSRDIINLAQEDYITPAVNVLKENLVQIFEKEKKASLSALSLLGLNRTTAYMALLFLSKDGGCCLEQEEFYSELYVTKSEPQEADAAQEAAAWT